MLPDKMQQHMALQQPLGSEAGEFDNGLPGLKILWPEVDHKEQDRIDGESAAVAQFKHVVFKSYVKYKTVRATADALAKEAGGRQISYSTVSRYVREVYENYCRMTASEAQSNAAMMLAKYVTLETELWEQWELSKGELVETTSVRRTNSDGTPYDTASVKKKQTRANIKIADAIDKCLYRQSQLLGLIDKVTDGKGLEGMTATKLVAGVAPEELV